MPRTGPKRKDTPRAGGGVGRRPTRRLSFRGLTTAAAGAALTGSALPAASPPHTAPPSLSSQPSAGPTRTHRSPPTQTANQPCRTEDQAPLPRASSWAPGSTAVHTPIPGCPWAEPGPPVCRGAPSHAPHSQEQEAVCTLRSPLAKAGPGPPHLLLARGLPLALLYGHLQSQVVPTADPLLLIHPERQAGGIRLWVTGLSLRPLPQMHSPRTPRPPRQGD